MKKNAIYNFYSFIVNLIFPRNIYCIVCNKPINKDEKYSICSECKEKIKFIDKKVCIKCGKPLDDWYYPDECPDCIQNKHYFTRGFSCVEYDEITKNLIYDFKYNEKSYIGYHLAEIICDKLKKIDLDIDFVVPVPLHKKREQERGYNQSELICRYISLFLGYKVIDDVIKRTKYTKAQNVLKIEERKTNIKHAFEIDNMDIFKNKSILLVDDVYTTGSTVDECSKVIKKCNPKKIFIITFATRKNIN